MIEGIILCFSPGGGKAHIWCATNDAPLCLAYREDFARLWGTLEIGSHVRLRTQRAGPLLRASHIELCVYEDLSVG